MTEINEQTMTREEFEEHHARTGQYIARVGKLWEGVAEEQESIVKGKGYKYLGYNSWLEYWLREWQEASGWTATTVTGWMKARRRKLETPRGAGALYDNLGASQWVDLGALDASERTEFLDKYDEYKPKSGTPKPLREAIKEFKSEREKPGVIERMREAGTLVPEYPSGSTREERAYNAASELLSVAMDVTPESAADSISPGLAQTTAQRYEVLIPWIQRFVGQLHHRAGRR